jgi:hypothetical protein
MLYMVWGKRVQSRSMAIKYKANIPKTVHTR